MPFPRIVLPTARALAEDAAQRFARAAFEAVHSHGEFVVALSGGATPRGLYTRLAAPPYVSTVPWSLVRVLWGDERCVSPDQAGSNYRMARDALLDHVPIPAENVHRIRGEDDPVAAARAYEQTLRTVLRTPRGPPRAAAGARIDLILLGLGDDGHTASLFPGVLPVPDGEPWAVAHHVAALSRWRVTLMPVIINAAAEILFLVSGEAKAAIVRRVLDGPLRPRELPAHLIAPADGHMLWLLDTAAARDLEGHEERP
ncbi:MAG TPA: 6-phosphogluconolactonase [bacterium]|nr:6-phosphogluconolactonase [bacterium]